MRVVITGGAGFIGSAYVRDVLARRDGARITVLDKLTYAGNRANLAPVEADPEQAARMHFVEGDKESFLRDRRGCIIGTKLAEKYGLEWVPESVVKARRPAAE